MATADEILASVLGEESLTIDLDSRQIIIPDSIQNLGVESDDDVLSLTFTLPRYYDNNEVDLSTFDIHINYLNANNEGDLFEVTESTVDDSSIIFEWLVGRHAVSYQGDVTFNVCLKEMDGTTVKREFNTTVATLPVLRGLETSEAVIQEHADLLAHWKEQLFGAGDTVEQQIKDAGVAAEQQIKDATDAAMLQASEEIKMETANAVSQVYKAGEDTIADLSEAKVQYEAELKELVSGWLGDFVVIGDTEPESGPVLWFDTSRMTSDEIAEVLLVLGSAEDESDVMAVIDGGEYPVVNAESPVPTDDENSYIVEISPE